MIKKRLLGIGLTVFMLTTLVACGEKNDKKDEATNTTQTTLNQDYVACIEEGLDTLENSVNTKGVTFANSTTINGKSDSIWLTYASKDYNYTQFPVDDKGNPYTAETVTADATYMLADYSDANEAYVFSVAAESEDTTPSVLKLEHGSNEILNQRINLNLRYMLDKFTNIDEADYQVMNFTGTEELVTIYKATLPSKYIPDVVSTSVLGIYKNYAEKHSDADIKHYFKIYSDYLLKSYVSTDADVYIFVSDEGVRGVDISYSGAGLTCTYSAYVISFPEEPLPKLTEDITKEAVSYTASVKNLATLLKDDSDYELGLMKLQMNSNANEALENIQKELESESQSEAGN